MSVSMGHCRFTNTVAALEECREALLSLEDANYDDPLYALSKEERRAAIKLIRLCGLIDYDFEGIANTEQT